MLPSARVVSVLCCQDISGASGLELGAVRVQGPLTHRMHELAWRVGSTGMAKARELRQPRGTAVGAGKGGGRMGTGAQVAGMAPRLPHFPGYLQSSEAFPARCSEKFHPIQLDLLAIPGGPKNLFAVSKATAISSQG